MERLEMYHGSISKSRAEELLAEARQDGSFLIRDSESVPDTYCICVLYKQCVFTYRLFQVEGNLWKTETAPGVKERLFRNVNNLITAFQHPDQGMAMPLLYPVSVDQYHNYHQRHPLHQQHNRKPKPSPQKHINC
ncbi:SH2 domain containing 1A duplicate a [Pygocentrus nattereri]|uniref:SH2 domain-containing protein n=1 Tax=Pygocentrus nattereri TaxID=42514 RepID=A0A3B4CQI8_PYGNA|nr:SH2 domain containing 1A duplicate a [Pygocentrus nattereri]